MSTGFYKIPFQLTKVMEGQELPSCDLAESIRRNLDLIITTRFGEHRCDPSFGCEIWDLDFELIISENLWEEKLRQSLLKSINSHETRISNVQLNVTITEIEKFQVFKRFTEIKKRVDINLSAVIHKTGESFPYDTKLFLSPLSVD